MTYRPCSVVNQDCTAPANLNEAYTRASCASCGQPVCLKCSKRVNWYGKRSRVCDDCREDRLLAEDCECDTPSPERRALDYIYENLCALERNLGSDLIGSVENARLLHRSIEACKYLKQPEWGKRFSHEAD